MPTTSSKVLLILPLIAAPLLASCGGGPACNASLKMSDGLLAVTVKTNGKADVVASDAQAVPPSVNVTILHAPFQATLHLNDSSMNPVKVTVYANRTSSTCTVGG